MPEFNSIAELEAYLNSKIRNALETDVKEQTVKTLKEHVVEDIYNKYEPTQYQRTGGLLQDSNIESKMENDNTLSVRSIREEDGRDISQIIESGRGYSWTNSEIARAGTPRPFHKEAAKELENGLAREAMKNGLKKQGLHVQ